MLLRCPKCGTDFRMVEIGAEQIVVKYLCPGCDQIVRVDLDMDEVESSSTSSSFKALHRKYTILVSDDNDQILEMAEGLLTRAGYNVILASDGEQALDRIDKDHPDLVVLDLLMPKRTGFDVIREVSKNERTRDTRIIAMSGVYKDNILEFLQKLGVKGFLSKDMIEETLVFRVEQILGPADSQTPVS